MTHGFAGAIAVLVLIAGQSRGDEPPGRPIEGIVVDESGRPVAGARVRMGRYWKAPDGAVSGAEGRFVLRDRGAMMLTEEELIATTPDGRLQAMVTRRESADMAAPMPPVRIVLKPSLSVTVDVRDAAGKPVADAAVDVVAQYLSMASGRTDRDGRIELRYPDGPNVEWITALKPGVGFDDFENYRLWPPIWGAKVPASVSLVLNGALRRKAKVVDSKGKPVEGVTFSTWLVKKRSKIHHANIGGIPSVAVRSDRDGILTLDWIPVDLSEPITLLMLPERYHSIHRLVLAPGENEPMPTLKVVRNATLRGKVVRTDGSPAAGVLVEAAGVGEGPNDQYRSYGLSGHDGRYAIVVPPRLSYMIGITDRSWAAKSLTGIVVKDEGIVQEVPDLQLVRGTVLRGRITAGPDREPVPETWISLIAMGDPLPNRRGRPRDRESRSLGVGTDTDGRYAFRVGPGEYNLSVSNFDEGGSITVEDEADIVRDFHRESLDGIKEHHLRGLVVDAAGDRNAPVAGATVSAFGELIVPKQYEGRTDERGRFDLTVLVNPSFLYARNAEASRAAWTPLKPGKGLALIRLGPAVRLVGRVVDSAGKPRSGWKVGIWMHVSPEWNGRNRLQLQTQTDQDGRYAFEGIVPGTTCEVMAPANGPSDVFGPVSKVAVKAEGREVRLKDHVVGPPA